MPGLFRHVRTAALGLLVGVGPASAQQPAPAELLPMPVPGAEAMGRLAAAGAPVADASPTPPATPAPPPFGGPLLDRQKLTGDWFGVRDQLRDHGITWDISSTNFYQGVTSGGLNTGFDYGGRADYLLHVDGQKVGLWQGLFVDLHAETLYGTSINSMTGSLLPPSLAQTLPIPNGQVTALTGVKVTQALSENFAVYAGKINTLDTFNQPFTGGARGTNGFWNAGMLLPPTLARVVPYSTYGAGFAVLSEMQPVFTVNVFDTYNSPTTSGFERFFQNGATVLAQATLPTNFFDRPGHHSIGGAYSSGRYTALDNSLPYLITQRLQNQLPPLPTETGSWAVYYMFDQAVWVDPADPKRSWGVFGNLSLSDGNPNPIRWASNIGVGGSSPFACRKGDTFGVGYFYIGLSDSLKTFAPRVLPLGDEHGVELFYNTAITPWFHITPDIQVISPVRSMVDTSLNVGIRGKIDF